MPAEDGRWPATDGAFLRAATRLASALLAATVALMTVQVILRFGFNAPRAWAEEVDRYLFLWAVYIGAAIAVARDSHIRVTILVERAGPWARRVSDGLTRVLGVLSFGFVAYYGFALAWDNRASVFYTLPFMPQVVFYLSVPTCMTVMVLWLAWPRRRRPPDD